VDNSPEYTAPHNYLQKQQARVKAQDVIGKTLITLEITDMDAKETKLLFGSFHAK
jgi:hypothetical protein